MGERAGPFIPFRVFLEGYVSLFTLTVTLHTPGCPRDKKSIIMNISILEFYGYIDGYFDKNIGKVKINKNTLKFI